MKVIFTGTNHKANEENMEITIKYEGEDTWTFSSEGIEFTISDLEETMNFLSKQIKH